MLALRSPSGFQDSALTKSRCSREYRGTDQEADSSFKRASAGRQEWLRRDPRGNCYC